MILNLVRAEQLKLEATNRERERQYYTELLPWIADLGLPSKSKPKTT